jgi:hypothetical protein
VFPNPPKPLIRFDRQLPWQQGNAFPVRYYPSKFFRSHYGDKIRLIKVSSSLAIS